MKKELIDVVITWVDGNDPQHTKKLNSFLPDSKVRPTGAQETRYGNVNEIYFSLFSIFTFAPFVNNIYIVTDEQKPDIESLFELWFPERTNQVKIVDHKEIFEGYQEYLPTFNSRTIESMLWRIKGLSQRFVYFNDDMFLIRPIKEEDWFVNNVPVLRGKKTLAPIFHVIWQKIQLILNSDKKLRPSFHLGQYNAAKVSGFNFTYFVFSHTPHPILKQNSKTFLELSKERIEQQLKFKFRHFSQFNFISYCYHLTLKKEMYSIQPFALSYVQPVKRKKNYINKKIALCEKKEAIKFMCVQSLDLCSKEDQNKILDWIHNRCIKHLKTLNLSNNKK